MRVTTMRGEKITEVYDVADALRGASDEALIAAVEPLAPTEASRGPAFETMILDRGADDVDAAAAELTKARDAYERATERAKALVDEAAEAGMSEHELGRRFGVDRMTIRRWRGKA